MTTPQSIPGQDRLGHADPCQQKPGHAKPVDGRRAYLQRLSDAVDLLPVAACISDPSLPDNPIVHANGAFLSLTEYERDEVEGRNCRFLQGPDTDPRAVREIADAIANQHPIGIDLVNHRKSGTSFINSLVISPIHHEGELVAYLGVQSAPRV